MNFTINLLERNTDDGVVVAHWTAKKESGEYSASSYGTCGFTPDPSAEGYIPYENLSEADVIGWVEAEVDSEALEAGLDASLAEQENPSVLAGVPWE